MDIILYFATSWASLSKGYQVSVFVLSVAYLTYMVYVSVTDRVVVYFDEDDFRMSLVTALTLVLSVLLWLNAEPFHSTVLNVFYDYILRLGLVVITLVLFTISSFAAYGHNKNILIGIMVSLFKFFYALVSTLGVLILIMMSIASLFTAIQKADEKEYVQAAGYTVGTFIGLEAIYRVFEFAHNSLINGERVYLKRGWHL